LPPAPPAIDQATQAILDKSVASLCSALKGLGLSSSVTVLSLSGFSGTIMGRLDSVRTGGDGSEPGGGSGVGDGKMALGALQKSQPAPQAGALGPFTLYASGSLLGGNSQDMPGAAGFTYGASSGMIGLEYSVNRNLILGLAASFTRLESDTTTGSTADADVIHGALYLSYSTRQWFFDALAAYGTVTLDMSRPGAKDTVHGSTGVSAVGLAARTGYLFNLGKLRVGPIAGISFVAGKVDGYTESGSDPTAMKVAEQTVESLTGSAGIRFLAPFQMGGTLFVPYMNITLEHLFGDGTGSVTTSLTQAPGAPVSLSFPIFGARDYGKIEGGLTIELAPEASISLSGASTFAREDGQDYRFSAGFNWRF
jgi:outer membrane autotransporter protein